MPSTPVLNAQGQPVKSALRADDDVTRSPPGGPAKAVSIAEPEPEPLALEDNQLKRQFSAGLSSKRLSGRPPVHPSASSRSSVTTQKTLDMADPTVVQESPEMGHHTDDMASQSGPPLQPTESHVRHATQKVDRATEKLLSQVADWVQREKTKRQSKKPRKHHLRRKNRGQPHEETTRTEDETPDAELKLERTLSNDSASSGASLHALERIVHDGMAALGLKALPHHGARLGRRMLRGSKRPASRSSLHLARAVSSDTDYVDGDALVPSCDVMLDNTKTLKYGQGTADDAASVSSRLAEKEEQAWTTFKNEIIRLAHTLRLKGWRRVALDSGEHITVERLSGALTNAVYVVTPPATLPNSPEHAAKKKPPKLLLRIYGPNVENLIDRDIELAILKRLARKKIGPRLLGTFKNGRFEQYFNAEPLTPELLRDPATSKQIAKRMRELHNGVDLLEEEKDDGPTVFRNWDCWVGNVEKRTLFLDQQVGAYNSAAEAVPRDYWKKGGFVCGTEWAQFQAMVDRYREFLVKSYGGNSAIREKLVFAHNDTQYGNILRVRPDDEKSPLLQPENQHKQLIVIDFEYASANLPGLEFANHFTEWAYNYHDATASYACRAERLYPNLEEQHRFIKAYLDHHPEVRAASSTTNTYDSDVTPAATPLAAPAPGPSSTIVDFMLDARVPPGGWKEEERKASEQSEASIAALLHETRLWRAMNSAQWVAWGIVQAKIAGFSVGADDEAAPPSPTESEGTVVADEGEGDKTQQQEDEGFDYLSYAHERALFFWGDCVQMGMVKLEELPEGLRGRVKLLEY